MSHRSTLMTFLLGSLTVGAATSLLLMPGCDDFLTGQDPEPPGPLLVTRLTLRDPGGDNAAAASVFTDTSSPLDCTDPQLSDTTACVNNPFKDRFSLKNSPPTPDSSTKMRIVFNKIPYKLNGQDLENIVLPPGKDLPDTVGQLQLTDPNVCSLTCEGTGCGVPLSYNTLQVIGSDLSPDPTTFDYGPALQMEVLTSYSPDMVTAQANLVADPLNALEPGTIYHVALNKGLSGRNPGDLLQFDDRAQALLTFATTPFQVIRTGIGDTAQTTPMAPMDPNDPGYMGADPFLGDACIRGSGAVTDPWVVGSSFTDGNGMCQYSELANDGVVAIYLNAGVDQAALQSTSATATVSTDGGQTINSVAVMVTNGVGQAGMTGCSRGNQRALYVAPVSGTWAPGLTATQTADIKVILKGADIRDVSQLRATDKSNPQAVDHPPKLGRHVLSGDVVLKATVKTTNTRVEAIKAADVVACS